jgi:isocitrate dehydrogenase kinase/phosphatase
VPEKREKKEEPKPRQPAPSPEEVLRLAVGYGEARKKKKYEEAEGILVEGLENVSTEELFNMLNKLYNALSRLAEAKIPEEMLNEIIDRMLETETLLKNEIYLRQIAPSERARAPQPPPEEERTP